MTRNRSGRTAYMAMAAVAMAGTLLVGCSQGGGALTDDEAAKPDDAETAGSGGQVSDGSSDIVRVGVGPFLSFSGLWTAMGLGYFEEEGIEVEISNFLDASMAVPPLVAGELDVAGLTMAAGMFNTLGREGEFKLVVDGAQEREDSGIVAFNVSNELYDSGVTGVDGLENLKGKKIGVTALGSINQYVTARALEAAGLDPTEDVEWVIGIPQPDMIGALSSGQIDAANFAIDLAQGAESAGAGKVVVRGFEVAEGLQGTLFGMSDDFLNEKRDVAERFTIALLRGIQMYSKAHEDPEGHPEVLAAIAEHTNVETPEKLLALHPWWPWVEPEGRLNIESIREQQDYWVETWEMVDTPADIEEIVDTSLVDAALEKLSNSN